MTRAINIGLAQINPTVGDITGNVQLIAAAAADGAAAGCELVVFPELCVSGYPPEDLVLRDNFLDQVAEGVAGLAEATGEGPALLVGAPWREDGATYNAALLLADGAVQSVVHKTELPNYGVFDEKRVFAAGGPVKPISFAGVQLGVLVCEDMWIQAPAQHLRDQGADMLVVINGSPFETDKTGERGDLARARVQETGLPLVYVNQVGGQDELVFDGVSFVLDANGAETHRLAAFAPEFAAARFTEAEGRFTPEPGAIAPEEGNPGDIYRALVLGLTDYVAKNGFPGVLIGLSGGINSALSAVVAADALGPERVHCVMMPSPYTSRESIVDAAALAANIGTPLQTIGIGPAMNAFDEMLKDVFAGRSWDETEENIQARARGVVLMALSNKFGQMVLSTGNKSEMSVGYATLYGDMCGGYSVLKDVYKTTVFALARWRNENHPAGALAPAGAIMPERIITKPPSAELKPDQRDDDSLPPYEVLDDILHGLIEDQLAIDEVTARGHDAEVVARVWRMLNIAEYKRRQAPPGVKITRLSFGRDRRYPITNAFSVQPHKGG